MDEKPYTHNVLDQKFDKYIQDPKYRVFFDVVKYNIEEMIFRVGAIDMTLRDNKITAIRYSDKGDFTFKPKRKIQAYLKKISKSIYASKKLRPQFRAIDPII